MHLKRLTLHNYKNVAQAELELSPKLNCILGLNGMGKTNLLDAIYYLSFCKSCFSPDAQVVLWNEEKAILQGLYERNDKEENVLCSVVPKKKKSICRNRVEYSRLSDHIGLLPLVMISPFDHILIDGNSEHRRKFMDGIISQFNQKYLHSLLRYNRALMQRNQVLRTVTLPTALEEQLNIWDAPMALYAKKIHEARQQFIEHISPFFSLLYQEISGDAEQVEMTYVSSLTDCEEVLSGFRHSRDKDKALGYTSFGVHRDDISFSIKGYPLKNIGSQGQRKSYLLALKFAQYDFIREQCGIRPILLLDDVFDKLDSKRVEAIVHLVSKEEKFGQIFLSDTDRQHLERIVEDSNYEYHLFTVADGMIKYEKK